jgi:hypothetical protein
MTWKVTALVSGAGLVATWLASVPSPTVAPQVLRPASSAQPSGAPPAASLEIQELADRLARRRQPPDQSVRPARDPFRFAADRGSFRPDSAPPAVPVEVAPAPADPVIRLSGVAMDLVGAAEVWTAILTTPAGLVLAREGEAASPGWTVTTIQAERVTILRPDGSTLTLPLSGK